MSQKLLYLISFVLVLSVVLTSQVDAAPLGLVGWWKFDGDFQDSSGLNNHGTPGGSPTFVAGHVGSGALDLGGDDWVIIDGVDDDVTGADFSLSAWIKSTQTNQGDVIALNDSGSGHPLEFYVDDGGYPGRYDGGDITYPTAPRIGDGEWHMMTWVKNGSTAYIYVDGVEAVTYTSSLSLATVERWSIGQEYDSSGTGSPSNFYTGEVDDVRIYNRPLPAGMILDLFNGIEPVFVKAESPEPADCDYIEDTWVNLSWSTGDTAASHDVYLGENLNDVTNGTGDTFRGNQTSTSYIIGFPGFPYPDGLVPGTTYYWRIDEVEADGTTTHEGNVWSFTISPRTAYIPDPADGTELVDVDVRLSWTPGFGSKLHYVYFGDNFDDVNNAAGGLPLGTTTYSPGPLEMAGTYYWRVDEFDIIETHKGDVWSFTTEGAVAALAPSNGAVDVKQTQIITWSPSVFAASHELYFGTDKDAVKNADTGSPEYKGTRDLGAESYDPGMLEWDTAYYWRIDEVNNTNPDSPWTGILWSFTTANFLIVDDFESYNDLDPAEADSNRIFNAWIDGYDDPTNGSLVGYDTPPFAEQTIVHGGNQSLPLYYDNSVGYSEATLTLTYPRDWTENGVNTLMIWFRGLSDNAAETLYVVLNGNAVVSHDNPDAAQIYNWTEWTIDLQAFADQGVDLANVNTIGLGLGDRNNPQAGGSGTMYFDDIRLYPPAQ